MRELFVATRNKGKLKEFEALFAGVVDRLLSPVDIPEVSEVIEDGATFQENAVKKARAAALATGKPVLADDSGLVVDALNDVPFRPRDGLECSNAFPTADCQAVNFNS